MFGDCAKLKTINGNIIINNLTTSYTVNMFKNCSSLINLFLIGINCNISLSDSPLLSYDSVKRIVDNKKDSTTAITVTVHATTYGYLTGTATDDAYTATGHTKAEWMALVTSGTAKALTFASA